MNNDRLQGRWKEFKGKVKEQWGKLTDDDLDVIAGRRDQLLGRIQQRHGIAKDDADRQVRDWEARNPEYRFDDAHEGGGKVDAVTAAIGAEKLQ